MRSLQLRNLPSHSKMAIYHRFNPRMKGALQVACRDRAHGVEHLAGLVLAKDAHAGQLAADVAGIGHDRPKIVIDARLGDIGLFIVVRRQNGKKTYHDTSRTWARRVTTASRRRRV